MTRRSSPRPDHDRATAIRYDEAVLHLWGDPESGYVGDRIYASSSLIHLIEFSLRPRERFTHSEDNRTIFAADEVLHVTEGEMLLVNPETGEAVLAREGESVFFRRDTWHHAVNRSNDRPLRVMELFAPPPSTGASSAYARTQSVPAPVPVALRRRPLAGDAGRWSRAERDQETRCIPPDRRIVTSCGEPTIPEDDLLVGLVCSTEHLTAGRASASSQDRTAWCRHHGGDLVAGGPPRRGSRIPARRRPEPPTWFELGVGDGFYVPQGRPLPTLRPLLGGGEILFGVAPTYLPGEG